MEQLRGASQKFMRILTRDPIMLSMAVVVTLFLGYSAVELWRSNQHQQNVESFRSSATVQNLVTEIDRLSRSIEDGDRAIVCSLDTDTTLREEPHANTKLMLETISKDVEQLYDNWPSFSSAGLHVPSVRESREISGELYASIEALRELLRETTISDYCFELNEVLSESEFLQDLAGPEGPSALFVGQIENFWVNMGDVQDNIRAIRLVPAQFAQEHQAIIAMYEELAQMLREDTNNIEAFSSRINEKLAELDTVFETMRSASTDLQELPEKLQLQSAVLR